MGKRKGRLCSAEGCTSPHNAKGYCAVHYQKWKRWGDPLASAPPPQTTCSFAGCGRPHASRGLCDSHYSQLRNGVELRPIRAARPGRKCSVEGCGKQHEAHGYCVRHCRIWQKYGNPFGKPRPADLPDERWLPAPGYEGTYEVSTYGRVWSIPRFRSSGGMLQWLLDKDGYPGISMSRDGKERRFLLHRLVLRTFVGPRPTGLVIRHLDGNVFNPRLDNICYGTYSENELDKIVHGTHPQASKTHCKHGHEFTPENTIIVLQRSGRPARRCRECRRLRNARQREAKRLSLQTQHTQSHSPAA